MEQLKNLMLTNIAFIQSYSKKKVIFIQDKSLHSQIMHDLLYEKKRSQLSHFAQQKVMKAILQRKIEAPYRLMQFYQGSKLIMQSYNNNFLTQSDAEQDPLLQKYHESISSFHQQITFNQSKNKGSNRIQQNQDIKQLELGLQKSIQKSLFIQQNQNTSGKQKQEQQYKLQKHLMSNIIDKTSIINKIIKLYESFFYNQNCPLKAEEIKHLHKKKLCPQGLMIPTIFCWLNDWIHKQTKSFIKKQIVQLSQLMKNKKEQSSKKRILSKSIEKKSSFQRKDSASQVITDSINKKLLPSTSIQNSLRINNSASSLKSIRQIVRTPRHQKKQKMKEQKIKKRQQRQRNNSDKSSSSQEEQNKISLLKTEKSKQELYQKIELIKKTNQNNQNKILYKQQSSVATPKIMRKSNSKSPNKNKQAFMTIQPISQLQCKQQSLIDRNDQISSPAKYSNRERQNIAKNKILKFKQSILRSSSPLKEKNQQNNDEPLINNNLHYSLQQQKTENFPINRQVFIGAYYENHYMYYKSLQNVIPDLEIQFIKNIKKNDRKKQIKKRFKEISRILIRTQPLIKNGIDQYYNMVYESKKGKLWLKQKNSLRNQDIQLDSNLDSTKNQIQQNFSLSPQNIKISVQQRNELIQVSKNFKKSNLYPTKLPNNGQKLGLNSFTNSQKSLTKPIHQNKIKFELNLPKIPQSHRVSKFTTKEKSKIIILQSNRYKYGGNITDQIQSEMQLLRGRNKNSKSKKQLNKYSKSLDLNEIYEDQRNSKNKNRYDRNKVTNQLSSLDLLISKKLSSNKQRLLESPNLYQESPSKQRSKHTKAFSKDSGKGKLIDKLLMHRSIEDQNIYQDKYFTLQNLNPLENQLTAKTQQFIPKKKLASKQNKNNLRYRLTPQLSSPEYLNQYWNSQKEMLQLGKLTGWQQSNDIRTIK